MLLGLESNLCNIFTFHLFSSQVAALSDSHVKIPERWYVAWGGGGVAGNKAFCDFSKGLTGECRKKNSFCFSPRVCTWLLSLFYDTKPLVGNTHFSLKPEALTMKNPFKWDTIIAGWGRKLCSHLLIELSPLCDPPLICCWQQRFLWLFSPSESRNGGLF